jgi:hypothetical protein
MQISYRSDDGLESGGVINRPELFAAAPEMARLLLSMGGAHTLLADDRIQIAAVLRKAGVLT